MQQLVKKNFDNLKIILIKMEPDFSACTSKKLHNILLTNINILIIPTEVFTQGFINEWNTQRPSVGGV